MRIIAAGAQITTAVVEVLETLQGQPDIAKLYIGAIDSITRAAIEGFSGNDERDAETLSILRALQMMRRDIEALASPSDADLPENDTPAFTI
ncbi:MAG: hypothetical protein NC102_00240 [Clostridium sp.]|nr:hypothetical protein [Clostridium sp.]